MNHIAAIFSVLALAASFAAVADKPTQAPCAVQQKPAGAKQCKAAAKTTVAATALLSDGSTIKGELLMPKITGSTVFLGKLALNPAIVKSIAFSGADNTAKVELENGDMFTMKVRDRSFTVKSVLGKLEIPRRAIRSLTLAKRRAAAKGGDGLVFYCTFDSKDSVTTPEVGPRGTFLRGEFMQGKVGMAMQTTVYSQNATFELPADFFNTSGCIEFWAKSKSLPSISATEEIQGCSPLPRNPRTIPSLRWISYQTTGPGTRVSPHGLSSATWPAYEDADHSATTTCSPQAISATGTTTPSSGTKTGFPILTARQRWRC